MCCQRPLATLHWCRGEAYERVHDCMGGRVLKGGGWLGFAFRRWGGGIGVRVDSAKVKGEESGTCMQGVVIPRCPTACVFRERAGDAKALWGLGEADVLGAENMLGVGWISVTASLNRMAFWRCACGRRSSAACWQPLCGKVCSRSLKWTRQDVPSDSVVVYCGERAFVSAMLANGGYASTLATIGEAAKR